MLKVENNSRQVPKTATVCANKKYYDIMYAYLQCISEAGEEGKRYFKKKDINFTKLGNLFGISRQTASTKFKNLKDLCLIREVDKDLFELVQLRNDIASLIPYQTLKVITDTLSENAISTYVYLLNCYYGNSCQSFQFTLEQIKHQIGICTTTRSNDGIVTNILFVLERIGLIKYQMSTVKQEEDNFANIKTVYELVWLTNVLQMNGPK